MLIEQDVSLGLAKAIEVRHDKPRKTAASIVLFVAFILAFLLFLGFLISTIHYPLLVLCADVQGNDFCHTSWRCGFRSSNRLGSSTQTEGTGSVEFLRKNADRTDGCRS